MKIKLNRKNSYDVPQGGYRAVIREFASLKEPKGNCNEQARLKAEITFPTNKKYNYLVGKNYCTAGEYPEVLVEDLHSLFGEKLLDLQDEDGMFDLEKLIGMEVDLQIVHIHNDGYEKPFVYIQEILPAGSICPASLD